MPAPARDEFALEFDEPRPDGPFAFLYQNTPPPTPAAPPRTGFRLAPSGLFVPTYPEGYGQPVLLDAWREVERLRIVCGRLEAVADRLEGQ